MSLNETVSAERLHIGFFGRRNVGKSSLVNKVCGQELSLVSDVLGTTTDPVKKAMELLPLGPVVIIDTPGLDDEGELGLMRVARAEKILETCDIAVIVADAAHGLGELENDLIGVLTEKKIPYIIAYNKCDTADTSKVPDANEIYVSALSGENIGELKNKLGALAKKGEERYIVRDLLSPGDTVVLVMPQDEAAPKGRLILPQQQTIRDILDAHAIAVGCQASELVQTLEKLAVKPRLVICDSQVFGKVSDEVPSDIMLTSFSILFARYKGELSELVRGAKALSSLTNESNVLISEGCTHHRQCGDIGSVKMPEWIRKFTGSNPKFEFTSGTEFPDDLTKYSIVIHCGGCMLTEREIKVRTEKAKSFGVPIVNYGVAIAHMHGILKRSLEPFDIICE